MSSYSGNYTGLTDKSSRKLWNTTLVDINLEKLPFNITLCPHLQTLSSSSSILNKLKATKVHIKGAAVKLTIISKNRANFMQAGRKNSAVKHRVHGFTLEQLSYTKLTPVLRFHFPRGRTCTFHLNVRGSAIAAHFHGSARISRHFPGSQQNT